MSNCEICGEEAPELESIETPTHNMEVCPDCAEEIDSYIEEMVLG